MDQHTRKLILEKSKVSFDKFESIGLNWDELTAIYDSYCNEIKDLDKIGEFIANDLMKVASVHSVRFRSKDPIHLIEKIVRKRNENPDRIVTVNNYKEEITDLIGVRAIHLMKDQWDSIHEFILNKWDLQEKQTAYIREGDSKSYTAKFTEHGFNLKEHPAGYRSLHYIISTKPAKTNYFVELQVRTIFEEGWSEIDHKVRYPYSKDNVLYSEFRSIFNRLAGSADEMGSFIMNLAYNQQESESKYNIALERKDEEIKQLTKKIQNLKIKPEQKTDLVQSLNSLSKTNPFLISESMREIITGNEMFLKSMSGLVPSSTMKASLLQAQRLTELMPNKAQLLSIDNLVKLSEKSPKKANEK